jgi:hypothetical protein
MLKVHEHERKEQQALCHFDPAGGFEFHAFSNTPSVA